MKEIFTKKSIALVFLLLGLCLLAYGPFLRNAFMIDDYDLFLENPLTQNPNLLGHTFLPDIQKFWGIEDSSSSVYYRPICHFLPMAEYLMFHKDPLPYHLINLMFLWAIGVVAFVTFRLLTGNGLLAFLMAGFFCVHPINSMIVNYVSSGYLEVQILAMLASILFFLKALKAPEAQRYYFCFTSILFFMLAILCHETAVTLPLYIFAAGLWFSKDLRRVIKLSWPFFVVLALYFLFRFFFPRIKKLTRILLPSEKFLQKPAASLTV